MMKYIIELYLIGICLVLYQNVNANGDFVPVNDPTVQYIAKHASFKIPGGAVVSEIKSASRELVPGGWKYYILMDTVKYDYSTDLRVITECEAVAVYLAAEDRIYFPQPVVCAN